LFSERTRELLRIVEQRGTQARKALNFSPACRGAACVNRLPGFINCAPTANHIEILERESERIQHRMATVASWTRAMLGQSLTDRLRSRARLVVGEIRIDSWRRRRHGQAEDVVQEKFASKNGRSTIRIRRGRQQCALREQTASLLLIGES